MVKINCTIKCPDAFDDSDDNEKFLFKFRLNKISVVLFTRLVAKHDYHRLRACISQRTSNPIGHWDNRKAFILFDSMGYRCALNTSCISHAQFLFNHFYTPPMDEHSNRERIRVLFADGSSAMTFKYKIRSDDCGDEVNDLQMIFYDLDFIEKYIGDSRSIRTVYFTAADGEIIYLNADDIALLEVPLHYIGT